jgi:hypothetical protein
LSITKNCLRVSSDKIRKDLHIIKDALPYNDFTDIYKGITEWEMVPYYFHPNTSYNDSITKNLTYDDTLNKYPVEADYQWNHLLIWEQEYKSSLAPKVEKVFRAAMSSVFPGREIYIVRAKVNILTPQVCGSVEHLPHIDWNDGHSYMSCILYMNDSDGNTSLYDMKGQSGDSISECLSSLNKELELTPVANTCIVFPSALFHSSSTPSKVAGKARIVINFIFKFKE